MVNAILQTVRHCSIPGAGIFAGPHRYNYARALCCAVVVSFALCALAFSAVTRVLKRPIQRPLRY